MNSDMSRKARREFLKTLGYSIALSPLVLSQRADADGAPVRVEESDPAAAALGYKHDADSVDVQKYPRAARQGDVRPRCNNCVLYNPVGDGQWGSCAIFQGRLVKGEGWCNAWAPKG